MVKKSNLRQKLFKIIIRIQRAIGINIINTSEPQAQQDQGKLYRKSEIEVNTQELKQEKDLVAKGKHYNSTKAERDAILERINSQASPKFLKEVEDLFKKPVIVLSLPSKKSESNKDNQTSDSKK